MLKTAKKLICVALSALFAILAGCRPEVVIVEQSHVIAVPSLQMTAFAAKNVYIAQVLSVDTNSYSPSLPFCDDPPSDSFKMISFTVKIEEVFKGDVAEGETITDEIDAMYSDFLEKDGRYVFCTGFHENDSENIAFNDYGAVFLYRKGDKEQRSMYNMMWQAEDNVAAAVRINQDRSFSWLRDDVPWKPQNTEELYQQLYDGGALLSSINSDFSQNVTEIRCIGLYKPFKELDGEEVQKIKQQLTDDEPAPYYKEQGISTSNVQAVTKSEDIEQWRQAYSECGTWIYEPQEIDGYTGVLSFDEPKYETRRLWHVVLIMVDGKQSSFFAIDVDHNCLYDIENGYWIPLDFTTLNELKTISHGEG